MKTKKAISPLLVAFAFFNIYVVWGSTYLAVIYGLQSFPPFILISLRYLTAGLLLLVWCKIKGENLPERRALLRHALAGTLMLVGGTGVIAWAEQYISSGQAAILVATEPLMLLVIDRKRWTEYFSNKFIVSGLIIGFIGIFLFMKLGVAQIHPSPMAIVASVAILFGALLWIIGSLIVKGSEGKSSTVMNASVQLLAAGVAAAVVAFCKSEQIGFSFNKVKGEAWGGLLFLIVMGSLIAYQSFVWLLSIKPPAIISTHTYVNPVVAVFLGWLFIHEEVNTAQLLSLFIILAGILLVNVPGYLKRNKTQEVL
ncbi:EamA family transporter [Mucilaginibacter psychrotolerans]|uniref:EamA family transporter n=1 Tax=Mucilaginibacter psychrotolerans TaxID=1524096 RepID=A0A4Y8S4V5_9SPHI|nr:EamA family transporter [Mucilaginibacter psychrotolerans]TFF33691.1 EamA family transporter [Mucilaginibacter psychrotolerans]